jgi:hypothetical protein
VPESDRATTTEARLWSDVHTLTTEFPDRNASDRMQLSRAGMWILFELIEMGYSAEAVPTPALPVTGRVQDLNIIAELPGTTRAGETIVTRLADILVVQRIRSWIARCEDSGQGWSAALREEQIGRAILAMQREPGYGWKVESLARSVAVIEIAERFGYQSEAAFGRAFKWVMGRSPGWFGEDRS